MLDAIRRAEMCLRRLASQWDGGLSGDIRRRLHLIANGLLNILLREEGHDPA